MNTKKILMLLTTALLITIATACGVTQGEESQDSNPGNGEVIESTFKTYIATKEENNQVFVHYKAENTSGVEQTLTFNSGLKADLIVLDKAGNKVYQYSDNVMSTQAIEEVTLQPNEVLEYEFVLSEVPNGDYVVEAFLTATEESASESRVLMDLTVQQSSHSGETSGSQPVQIGNSLVELNQQQLDLYEQFKADKDSSLLANVEPFDIFQLYMYAKATEDFETLYYFHNVDQDNLPVAKFVEESTTDTSLANNKSFINNLKEVREFNVVSTEENRLYVEFQLPNEAESLQFKMEKGEDQVWRALWLPFQ